MGWSPPQDVHGRAGSPHGPEWDGTTVGGEQTILTPGVRRPRLRLPLRIRILLEQTDIQPWESRHSTPPTTTIPPPNHFTRRPLGR